MSSTGTDLSRPRTPSITALLLLGKHGGTPGFMQFLIDARDQGFGLDQPGDHDVPDDKWEEMSTLRMSALVAAFERARA